MSTHAINTFNVKTKRKAFRKTMRHQTSSMQALLRHFEIHDCEIILPRDSRNLNVTGLAMVVSPNSDKWVSIHEEQLVSLNTPIFVVHFFTGDESDPSEELDATMSAGWETHTAIVDTYTSIVKWFYLN